MCEFRYTCVLQIQNSCFLILKWTVVTVLVSCSLTLIERIQEWEKKCHAWTKQSIQKRSVRRENKRQNLKNIAQKYVVQQQGATPSHMSNLNSDTTREPIRDTESALPEILGDNSDYIPISEVTPEPDSALDTSQTSWTFPESPQPDVTLQARTSSAFLYAFFSVQAHWFLYITISLTRS